MKGLVLTSDEHSGQLVKVCSELFRNNVLTDVTLICDDKVKLYAHKIVLCAGSSFFSDFFVTNSHDKPMLYLKGIKQQYLLPVLQFIYNGETTISEVDLNIVLEVAKELEIQGLEEDVQKEEDSSIIPKVEAIGKLFNCFKCDVQTATRYKLMQHISKCHPDDNPRLEMENIEPGNNDVVGLNKSLSDKSNNSEVSVEFQCNFCEFVGATSEARKKHEALLHSLESNMNNPKMEVEFECTLCSFKSYYAADFRSHKKENHKNVKSRVKCSDCAVTLDPLRNTILGHYKSKHSEEKISCGFENCHYVAAREDSVREHLIKRHGNGGRYGCEKCSFRAMRPYQINQHMERAHQTN